MDGEHMKRWWWWWGVTGCQKEMSSTASRSRHRSISCTVSSLTFDKKPIISPVGGVEKLLFFRGSVDDADFFFPTEKHMVHVLIRSVKFCAIYMDTFASLCCVTVTTETIC